MNSRRQLTATNFPPGERQRFVFPGPAETRRRHRTWAHLWTARTQLGVTFPRDRGGIGYKESDARETEEVRPGVP